jgi:putative transposase
VFRFVEAEKANHSVQTMCRVLGVSRSGYYAWSSRPPSVRAVQNAELVVEIRRVHAQSDGTYGSRRVHAQLRREGHEVNVKRVERLMRLEKIQGAYVPPKRRRGGGDGVLGVDGVRAWPDLVKRDFQPAGPNELWCSDLKQIPTGEGVLHLASVLDCFSRRIVGWAMGPVADAPLVAQALRMAVSQRRPGEGIVFHSDRGCQYTAVTFGSACRAHAITQSNSRKGSPHDNEPVERPLRHVGQSRRGSPWRRFAASCSWEHLGRRQANVAVVGAPWPPRPERAAWSLDDADVQARVRARPVPATPSQTGGLELDRNRLAVVTAARLEGISEPATMRNPSAPVRPANVCDQAAWIAAIEEFGWLRYPPADRVAGFVELFGPEHRNATRRRGRCERRARDHGDRASGQSPTPSHP